MSSNHHEETQHFGKDDVDLGILSHDPEGSLAFAKATLFWDVPHNNNNNYRSSVQVYRIAVAIA